MNLNFWLGKKHVLAVYGTSGCPRVGDEVAIRNEKTNGIFTVFSVLWSYCIIPAAPPLNRSKRTALRSTWLRIEERILKETDKL